MFPFKPSILGYPHSRKPPYVIIVTIFIYHLCKSTSVCFSMLCFVATMTKTCSPISTPLPRASKSPQPTPFRPWEASLDCAWLQNLGLECGQLVLVGNGSQSGYRRWTFWNQMDRCWHMVCTTSRQIMFRLAPFWNCTTNYKYICIYIYIFMYIYIYYISCILIFVWNVHADV